MKSRNLKVENLKTFKLICKVFGHQFSFNAKDMDDATDKTANWCAYHSLPYRDYKVEETTDQKWLHNEYVN